MAGKIKVLRIIARLNIGGPARHVALLSEGLDSSRYDSMLVYGRCGDDEGDMSYLAKVKGVRSLFVPELTRSINPISDIAAFLKIFSIMRKERPHIVHTHTAKAGTLGRMAAVLAGVPIKVHTYHGHVFYGYFNRPLTAFFVFVERVLASFTDRIVAISEDQKEELVGAYGIGRREKYSVINIGLDLDRLLGIRNGKGSLRKRYGLGEDDTLVGIVGRLIPVKNHCFFIRVARRVKNILGASEFERVKFLIIGDGPERHRLVEYARSEGVDRNIVFTGWIKDAEEIYADLDIVALTSINEGTPLSLIEAMAAGKCVIATDVGGVRDVVGDIGILVGRDDEAAFAKRLSELISSPAMRRDIGRRSREYAMNKYSKGSLVKAIDGLYGELLKEKGITV